MAAHFSSRVTNFEFVKSVKESGFTFKSYKEKIDLSRIAHLDLDRVARDLDISILQEHIGILVNCDLGDLKGIDPGLKKFLQLGQLCMDYCLYCQDFLSASLNSLESVHVETLKELEALKVDNKTLKDKLKKLNRKKTNKHVLSEEKENLLASYHECIQCKKGYSSQEYLESHIQRRHSVDKGLPANEMFQELKNEIEALRAQLIKEKEPIDTSNYKELMMKREENMWAEIEKSQAEQRIRHQTEIADLTANFQQQLKQSLTDLAANLSAADSYAMQSKLSSASNDKNESTVLLPPNVESTLTELNEMWQSKFEQQEYWFKSENSKLMDQLQNMQKRDEDRWSQYQELLKEKSIAPSGMNMLIAAPVPATRHKKAKRQTHQPTSSVSKLDFSDTIPSAPPLTEVKDFMESTDESTSIEETRAPAQNVVVCMPKVTPSRPKSSMQVKQKTQTPESTSEGEETSERSVDIDETLKEMHDAVQHNPLLMESLKNEVENKVQEKMVEVGIGFEERLSKSEFNAINDQLKDQRKIAEKQYHGFWKLRRSLEKKVDKVVKEEHSVLEESNILPSKVKQHPSFFSKLTKRYNKKDKRAKSETQIFTSTPMKNSPDRIEPQHGILKSSKDNVAQSHQDITEKQNTEMQNRNLTRAQSLPSNKFVSFVNNDEDKENTLDEPTSKSFGGKNPFVVTTSAKQSQLPENNFSIDDLENELKDLQFSNFKKETPGYKNDPVATKLTKSNLSLNLSDDNSWDLEDI